MIPNTRVKVEASDVKVMYFPQLQGSFLGIKYWMDISAMTTCDIIHIAWDVLGEGYQMYTREYAETVCQRVHDKYKADKEKKEKERLHQKTKTVDYYKFP